MVNKIFEFFPDLSETQRNRYEALDDLYRFWNQQINVISRKDIDQLYLKHVLHSLSISRFVLFKSNTSIMDLGCGGGFPGIPLAILLPEVNFYLIDARRKKIKVVHEILRELGLENCRAEHLRAEDVNETFDFVVTRAVARLYQLWQWSLARIHLQHKNAIPNGLISLKGGDLRSEIKEMPKKTYVETQNIHDDFPLSFFEEKKLVYVQR